MPSRIRPTVDPRTGAIIHEHVYKDNLQGATVRIVNTNCNPKSIPGLIFLGTHYASPYIRAQFTKSGQDEISL